MAFTVDPRIAMAQERRKFNLSAALKPAQARENPYANDVVNQQLARLAYGVGANIAGRDAQRLTNQQTAAQGALASLLMTGSVPGATAASAPTPAPTGFLARAKQFAMPSAPTVAQAGRQFAGATQITPELLAASGADPFQVATAQQTISATNLTRLRDNNLRQATGIASQVSQLNAANRPVPQELTDRLEKLKQNLPTILPAYSTKIIDVGGKQALVPIDILGNMAGKPVFAPTPLVSTGVKKAEEIEQLGTLGERKVDEAFGTALGKLLESGALADAKRNRGQITGVVAQLQAIVDGESDENLSGLRVGVLSELRPAMSVVNSAALQALETVEEVVQRNLRIILGAQFTEKEGNRLIARAYNPYLSEQQNLVRLKRLDESMKGQLDRKLAAIDHFQKTGSLRGFDAEVARQVNSTSIVDDTLESLSAAAPVPIKDWSVGYIQSFQGADGRQTEEWNRLLEDPETRQKLGDRMRELGLLPQSNEGG